MLDSRWVVDHLDEARAGLARRSEAVAALIDSIAKLAPERGAVITKLEQLRARKNEANAAMAKLDKKGPDFAARRDELRAIGDEVKTLEQRERDIQAELDAIGMTIPNIPDPSVPTGDGSAANPVVRTWGDKPRFTFTPKEHYELGVALKILDFDRGAKISGSRFTILRGAGARLERGLMQFMLDTHTRDHGYEEIWPPALVLGSALRGTSQLPKFEADLFKIARFEEGENARDLYLAPTAEVQVTNLHADEILERAALPVAYTAYTPCFRSEAGSYGKDTRGLIRQHQFDKVELVRFTTPDAGRDELEKLTAHAEKILQLLGLHYRVVELCTGDLGFAAHKTYDLEVWLPGQDAYREISSCSWFGDFQARRAKIRYRPEPGAKPVLVHTLNGSGLAIGRTLVALLEQGQQADGSILLPKALAPYMGGLERIAL